MYLAREIDFRHPNSLEDALGNSDGLDFVGIGVRIVDLFIFMSVT